MPEFQIARETIAGDTDVLQVSGFLDAHTFEQLEEALNGLFAQGRYRIVVDLSAVGYISSAGAGVFIAALSEAEENGGRVVIMSPTKSVLDVFDLLGLTTLFSIAWNRNEAMAAFGQ
jgi:anti-sigma B factor antagonist